jgi:transposase-like protein
MSLPSIYELQSILFNEQNCVEYLRSRNVFYENWTCETCHTEMKYYDDRQRFRCPTKICTNQIPLRKGSFFAKSKLPCHKILHIGYMWLKGDANSSIQVATKHSWSTISEYIAHFRQLVADSLDLEDSQIGGNGIEVEVDETKLGKRKYNRGHRVDGIWVLGGVERTHTKRVFLVPVTDRSADTLADVIHRHILPGSIVLSDLWKGYNFLQSDENYTHKTVNHSKNFVDPITKTHTNTIEGTWSGVKRRVPVRCQTQDTVDGHLWEFIWRRKNAERLWDALINALKEMHYDE